MMKNAARVYSQNRRRGTEEEGGTGHPSGYAEPERGVCAAGGSSIGHLTERRRQRRLSAESDDGGRPADLAELRGHPGRASKNERRRRGGWVEWRCYSDHPLRSVASFSVQHSHDPPSSHSDTPSPTHVDRKHFSAAP